VNGNPFAHFSCSQTLSSPSCLGPIYPFTHFPINILKELRAVTPLRRVATNFI
jgi:hypothetical protein